VFAAMEIYDSPDDMEQMGTEWYQSSHKRTKTSHPCEVLVFTLLTNI
jgi:hypothetical protein